MAKTAFILARRQSKILGIPIQ